MSTNLEMLKKPCLLGSTFFWSQRISYSPGNNLADLISFAGCKDRFTNVLCFDLTSSFFIVYFEDLFELLSAYGVTHLNL